MNKTSVRKVRWFICVSVSGFSYTRSLFYYIFFFLFHYLKGELYSVTVRAVDERRSVCVFNWAMLREQKNSTIFEVTKRLIATRFGKSSPSRLGTLTLSIPLRTWWITIGRHTLSHECHDTKPLFLCKAIQNELFSIERHAECLNQLACRHSVVWFANESFVLNVTGVCGWVDSLVTYFCS